MQDHPIVQSNFERFPARPASVSMIEPPDSEKLIKLPESVKLSSGNLRSVPNLDQVQTVSQTPLNKLEGKTVNSLGVDTVLLIICSNRPSYLDRTLSHVIKYHPKQSVPILISQDGSYPNVNNVIQKYQDEFKSLSSISFDHIHFTPSPPNKMYENGYFRLADHFAFALNYVFDHNNGQFKRVIILEEDLEIAPDFFEYFAALHSYLDDPKNNLLAISAWNDNGFTNLVKDSQQVYRSDFFPGLGWMLTRDVWVNELKAKWPRAYWDDWLREPKQRKGRQILRPEICRTLHFGTHGVSNAQYSEFLQTIQLNDHFTAFTKLNLDYLLESNWNQEYVENHVKKAPVTTMNEFSAFIQTHPDVKEVKMVYGSYEEHSTDRDSLGSYSRWSGVMNNVKAGVPRTAYKGIVSFWKDGVKVHLVPRNAQF
jgi:alpha-1,3-mannosyl-glycoprotein beta-1,2-N-acetylglucosaminyltransferase